jgi:hypothetical protein
MSDDDADEVSTIAVMVAGPGDVVVVAGADAVRPSTVLSVVVSGGWGIGTPVGWNTDDAQPVSANAITSSA